MQVLLAFLHLLEKNRLGWSCGLCRKSRIENEKNNFPSVMAVFQINLTVYGPFAYGCGAQVTVGFLQLSFVSVSQQCTLQHIELGENLMEILWKEMYGLSTSANRLTSLAKFAWSSILDKLVGYPCIPWSQSIRASFAFEINF